MLISPTTKILLNFSDQQTHKADITQKIANILTSSGLLLIGCRRQRHQGGPGKLSAHLHEVRFSFPIGAFALQSVLDALEEGDEVQDCFLVEQEFELRNGNVDLLEGAVEGRPKVGVFNLGLEWF